MGIKQLKDKEFILTDVEMRVSTAFFQTEPQPGPCGDLWYREMSHYASVQGKTVCRIVYDRPYGTRIKIAHEREGGNEKAV